MIWQEWMAHGITWAWLAALGILWWKQRVRIHRDILTPEIPEVAPKPEPEPELSYTERQKIEYKKAGIPWPSQ